MASGTIKNSRLKIRRLAVLVEDMTQRNHYYEYNIPQEHNYVMGLVSGWNGTASPFFATYDPVSTKKFYFIFGSSIPTYVNCDLYYYE